MDYKGYRIVQALNNHVMISKEGRVVLHAQCGRKLNKEDMMRMVDTCDSGALAGIGVNKE